MTIAVDRAKAILKVGHPQGVRCQCCPSYHFTLEAAALMAEALERAACRVGGYRGLVGDRCGKDYCDRCEALVKFEKLVQEHLK